MNIDKQSHEELIEQFDNMTSYELADFWTSFAPKIKEDPIKNFIEHPLFIGAGKEEGERYKASAPVRVVVKIFFNLELDSIILHDVRMEDMVKEDERRNWHLITEQMTETEIYKFMTGKDYVYGKNTYITNMNLIMGRRAGKTTLIMILSIMTVILDNWAPKLYTHPKATTLVMAQRKKDAQEILQVIKFNIEKSPVLRKFISKDHKDNTEEFNLSVPWVRTRKKYNGKIKTWIEQSHVQVAAEVASGKAVRGKTCVCIILDEFAFMGTKDSEAKINDKDLISAVTKNTDTIENYRLMKLSSPNITEGVFYEDSVKWDQ